MPKRNVRTHSTHAPKDPAEALIETIRYGVAKALPSPEALTALRRLIEHNDSESAPTKKVGAHAAIALLQKHYAWKGASISALNSLCRRAFGRKSWGTP